MEITLKLSLYLVLTFLANLTIMPLTMVGSSETREARCEECVMSMNVLSVEQYLPLIRRKAHSAWRSLPPQTRIWFGYEDLVQDGVVFALDKALPNYTRKRKAKVSTFLWHTLENHFKNRIWSFYAEERNDSHNVALEPLLWRLGHGLEGADYEKTLPDPFIEDAMFDMETMCIDSFLKMLEGSSPNFQKWSIQWFFRPGETKLHTKGRRFDGLVEEITHRGCQVGLDQEVLGYLTKQQGWRQRMFPEMLSVSPVIQTWCSDGHN